MARCNHRSGPYRAIALFLSTLVLGGPSVGCRELPSPPLRPASVPSTSGSQSAPGAPRDDVEPVQYIARPEASPPQDPAPRVEPVESEAALSLAEAITYGLRHNPRLHQAAAQVAAAREGAEIAFAPFLP
jgi:outer membrane protein TolC